MFTHLQQAMPPTAPAAPVKTILLVEDDPERAGLLMCLLLEKTPYRVLLASNSLAALHLISYLKPDLLIVRDQSPTSSGTQLSDQLRSLRGCEAVPILLLGSHFSTQQSKPHMVRLCETLDLASFLLIVEAILTQPAIPHDAMPAKRNRHHVYTNLCLTR